MNRHYQLTIILPLLILFFTACVGNGDEKTKSTYAATTILEEELAHDNNDEKTKSTPTTIPAIDEPEISRENSDEKTESTPTAALSQSRVVETASFQGVIFPAEQIAASPYWPYNGEPWTPSETDVMTLEEQLTGYLQDEHPDLWQKLESYTRQYWGTVTSGENRAVYANFFCDADRLPSFLDWRRNLVGIEDGGNCYFQTRYDIEDGIFVWLAINGES